MSVRSFDQIDRSSIGFGPHQPTRNPGITPSLFIPNQHHNHMPIKPREFIRSNIRLNMLILALPVFFASCNEEVDPNDPVIQREVSKRTEVIREELKTDQDIRHTIRLIAVCMLAGGTLFGLYRLAESGRWFSSLESPANTPSIQGRRREFPPIGRRVIDQPRSNPGRRRGS